MGGPGADAHGRIRSLVERIQRLDAAIAGFGQQTLDRGVPSKAEALDVGLLRELISFDWEVDAGTSRRAKAA